MLCSVCHLEPFKYKCPACGVVSCSLECVKRHKAEQNCSGVVDVTKYIKKDQISATDVNRDYNFFLNINRKIALGKSDAKKSKPLSANVMKRPFNGGGAGNGRPNKRPVFTNEFDSTNVSVRRGVNVRFLPKGMSRSNMNKTGFDKRKNCFNWTVEWLLIEGDINKVVHRFVSYKVSEAAKLQDCFPSKNFIKFVSSEQRKEAPEPAPEAASEMATEAATEMDQTASAPPVEDAPLNSEIPHPDDSANTAEPVPEFHLFIRNYSSKPNNKVHSINPSQMLADVLRDKTVLEFPTIYVSLHKEIRGFKILEGDALSASEESDSDSDSDSDSNSDSSEESSESDSAVSSSDNEEAPDEESTKGPDPAGTESVPLNPASDQP